MLHFSWRHAYILYFMFDPETHDSLRLKTIEITSSRLKTIQNDWATAPSLSFSIVSYRFFLEGMLIICEARGASAFRLRRRVDCPVSERPLTISILSPWRRYVLRVKPIGAVYDSIIITWTRASRLHEPKSGVHVSRYENTLLTFCLKFRFFFLSWFYVPAIGSRYISFDG